MKRFFTLLVVIMVIISGCSKKQATITGNFTQGTEKSYIYLSKIEIDQSIFIDSAKISNNNFRFKVEITDPTFFMVGTSDNEFVTILAEPGEKVSLKFNGKTPNRNYTVSGSEGSANIQKLDNDDSLRRLLLSLEHRKLASRQNNFRKFNSNGLYRAIMHI